MQEETRRNRILYFRTSRNEILRVYELNVREYRVYHEWELFYVENVQAARVYRTELRLVENYGTKTQTSAKL